MGDYIEEIKDIVNDKMGFCYEQTCRTVKTKVTVKCKFNHKWKVSLLDLRKGNWCKRCVTISRRNTIGDAQKLAKLKNGKCLSHNYTNNIIKLEWQCEFGHKWEASYNKVKCNRWCPYCSKKIKHTISDAKTVAKSKHGECLSDSFNNIRQKLLWKCKFGHTWKATFDNIKNHNTWCPKCNNLKRKYTINDANKIAINHNGKCLSKSYTNYNSKLLWECENKHVWQASFSSINSNKTWCPKCKLKSQVKLEDIMKKIFTQAKIYSNYTGFDWLINDKTGKRLEIDIFIKSDDFTLAIEYDGEGHFFPVKFGGCDEKTAINIFENVKIRDDIKNKKIAKNKDDVNYFVRFNYKEKIDKTFVIKKLKKLGLLQ